MSKTKSFNMIAAWMVVLSGAAATAQTGPQPLLVSREQADRYWQAKKIAAISDVIGGFNYLAHHAHTMRPLMEPQDAAALDNKLIHIMAALAAIPEIVFKNTLTHEPVPIEPKADRVRDLHNKLADLIQFFQRLQKQSRSPSGRKLFVQAEKQAGRMLFALPEALPIVDLRAPDLRQIR